MHKQKKVLFFGNIPKKNTSSSIGGATILALSILFFINQDQRVSITHKDIRKIWKPKLHLIEHFLWIIKFPFIFQKKDIVSFHTTWDFNFTVGPLLWLWAKIFNKRIIYHFFGGDFHTHFHKLPSFIKPIFLKTILSSDVIFFETKACIKYFENLGVKNIEWLPNARKSEIHKLNDKIYSKKFVFISRVINEKGINEIIEVSKLLDNSYVFDVYGPIDERYFNKNNFHNSNVNYKGELEPQEVSHIIKNYDLLLLPTYFSGEGYPGIVIEALAFGIPSITTNWISIPEIIQNNYNGFLIEPKNAIQLKQIIENINDTNYQNLRFNAFKSFENFDENIVFKKIIKAYLNE
ncbi:glycosyltransferase [Empedobacter sp. 225-1]|uniref:glycosyltransferase n=1 Tax=unclassified Empedobacter TaxID=2643773 RepID=UPI0025782D05|nr:MULTISPECIES: glycosyltransferase [unclassified Empedobacter]MDM1522349.1 glycosyltransferase [Empedobacter sp. 225-1]MDM1541846.1 glycosyltransferase [Empedobacter sp. 189-2]